MSDKELMLLPGWKQREMIVAGKISSRELVEASLRRIEKLDRQLNAFITVDGDRALVTADEADKAVLLASNPSNELGLLHGVPISIKDLELTNGLRTTLGCKIFEDWVPEIDSIVVERIRNAGAVIIGKTNTPEFGNSGETINKVAPICNNPWDISRTPGGSSGGAAVSVAAAMVSISTGTDGGGSVRMPCAFTGIYGIKATHGRIPRYGGVSKLAANQTSSSGPMTRTVRDSAVLLEVMAGHDSRDPVSLRQPVPNYTSNLKDGVSGMRIGYSFDLGYGAVEPYMIQAVEHAAKNFSELGADVEEADLVLNPPPQEYWWKIWTGNQKAMYGDLVEKYLPELMPYTVQMNYIGAQLSAEEYSRAIRQADEHRSLLEAYFVEYDLLILPTTAVTAYRHLEPPQTIAGKPSLATAMGISYGAYPFLSAFNMSGHPAASIPNGFDKQRLPIGLQIVGALGDELSVLKASSALENAHPWANHLPPVI